MNIKYSVRDIVESAMLIALAIVLDLDGLKIRIGSAGGSISFTMVPLFILAIRQGLFKSFIGIGIVYGLITCLKDGWGIQTYPFDYLLAYGLISVTGLFSKTILNDKKPCKSLIFLVISVILSVFLRFVFASISSMILYEYTFKTAIIYNIVYIGFSAIATLVALLILYKPLVMVNKMYPSKNID